MLTQIVDHLDTGTTQFNITKRNQFAFMNLCDIFSLPNVKTSVLGYLSQNFDTTNVFEFIKVAAEDLSSQEVAKEAYWILVYIYLRRVGCSDILETFTSNKTKQMLKNVNVWDYDFINGFFVDKKSGNKVAL